MVDVFIHHNEIRQPRDYKNVRFKISDYRVSKSAK